MGGPAHRGPTGRPEPVERTDGTPTRAAGEVKSIMISSGRSRWVIMMDRVIATGRRAQRLAAGAVLGAVGPAATPGIRERLEAVAPRRVAPKSSSVGVRVRSGIAKEHGQAS